MDELSFYNEDHRVQQQERDFTSSPQFMGLLSPEGSPPAQCFQVIEKSKFMQSCKNFTLATKNSPKENINRSGLSKSNTPSKGFWSLSSSGSMDDEHMEFFDLDHLEEPQQLTDLNFPSDLSSLISDQIIKNSPINPPEMRRPSVRRCLSMTENTLFQPKTPESLNISNAYTSNTPVNSHINGNCCFKRREPPTTTYSPIQSKRYRAAEKENLDGSFSTTSKTSASFPVSCSSTSTYRPILPKSMSMNDAEIMSALNRCEYNDGEPDLIGDFSKPYVLPISKGGQHRDLKSVSSHTVARLMNGDFNDKINSYTIIDCRYPYEYEGGHIEGAKNLYTQEQIIEEFFPHQKTELQQKSNESLSDKRRIIIIFHCEFSSERGPKLSRFLRNFDRERNTNAYPALHYPEIYLLHNGYKEFFKTHVEHCTPQAYRPMLEPSYTEEYRHFRAKSKSWNGDVLGPRLKGYRSNLML